MGGGRGGLERRCEPHGEHDEPEALGVIPREFFLKHEPREQREDRERDGLLDDLEPVAAKFAAQVALAVGRDHQAIEKRDAPRFENHDKEGFSIEKLELQVPIPREGHEDVGGGEEENGFLGKKAGTRWRASWNVAGGSRRRLPASGLLPLELIVVAEPGDEAP